MRILVVNLRRKRLTTTAISILLALVVMVSSSIGIFTKIYGLDLSIVQADSVPKDKIVVIDAGHGGEDPGAIGCNGIYEKELNLEMAMTVGATLEEKGYIVVYTRTDDRLLYTEEENIKGIRKISDLKNRCKFANRYPESTFISIHMNSFGDGRYSGLQVYYSTQNEDSRVLADKIQTSVARDLQKDNNRVIKPSNGMYLLDNISNTAVLIECGFLTNQEECEKLSKKEYQKELSFSIVCGIIEYIEGKN